MSEQVEPPESAYGVDHRGSRRLTGKETWFWYLFAGVTYVGVATFQKGLLNWIVGPAWLIFVVCVGPALVDKVRRRR